METSVRIEKEQIGAINFTKREVLSNPEQIKQRLATLHRSQTLGNLLHTKVRISFLSVDQNLYEVYTTVWAVGSEFVVLKGGITIPIRSIIKVE
ncbi:hypothetical protein [Algoriphagus limi]|uniref:Uncharacterized protein n=1 Tax=Algoriphagus limi TaxID=2975273 RepID=A0ABT2G4Y5_9BACT|nr:hypothetical protein [Algoriphagus limi]MCS5490323.1 hypothetical protein [Algoriphagus limi]